MKDLANSSNTNNNNFGWFFIVLGLIFFGMSLMARQGITTDAQMQQTILYNSHLELLSDLIFFGLLGLTSTLSGVIMLKSGAK